VVRARRRLEAQHDLHHPRDLVLLGAARAADGVLDLLGRVGDARQPALARSEHHHPPRLADRERALGVAAEEDVLHRDDGDVVLVEQLAHAAMDVRQPDLRRRLGARGDDAAVQGEQLLAAALDDAEARVRGARIDAEDDHWQ
jgi:hypothetical protein